MSFNMIKVLMDFNAQDFINKIFPTGWATFAQFAAFGVLVVFGMVFGYKPVKKLLKTRQEYIANNIKEAEEKKASATKFEATAQENVSKSVVEARRIISEAKEEATRQHDEILAQTFEEVKQAKLQADVEIEKSKEKALEDIHNEIVNVALDASKAILEREINDDDNSKLVNDFIKEVNK